MLNYKAINISNAEMEHSFSFLEELSYLESGRVSITRLINVLIAGGLSREGAGDFIDSEGIMSATEKAMKAVGEAGFLAKITEEQVKSLESPKKATKTSPNSGEATKA